ncbi:hypothetical protein G9F71_016310 [Clostridium sp. FP2]|uniref:hypothetical protein n=1 Tax=Clostridium sp. FP2 TaxID=2724481 RepID=UPI0013E90315|nr:hypothetical protein [Clostridium sp. FP2]MBZ9624415.1 hypothetical protein [Clostridium sp. FP2]
MMKFIYKEKIYTWDEWNHDQSNFINSIELPEDFKIDINIREISLMHDIEYSIAIDKFIELYSMIASARSALINAFEKFYDSNIISWDSGYKGQLWMRYQYLKNAIVWYNSCEDYIYQIIWFAYTLYPKAISSEESYLLNLKKCNYDQILKILGKLEGENEDAKDLKAKLKEYRDDPDVSFLREQLANNLKHRANIQVNGLEYTRMMGFSKMSKDGTEEFNGKWIEPRLIDIDETIEIIKNVHIKLVAHGRFILNFMNLENMFCTNEEGNKILNRIRKKSDYKRIDYNNIKK